MLDKEAPIIDDYSRTKVPEDKTVNGIRIASIIVGIGVTLPVFFVGSEVTQALGLEKAFWVFMGVCLVLSILCTVTAIIGNRTRLSTYMLLHFSFGKKGALLINLLVAITLLGWYAVTVEIFGQALTDAFAQLFNVSFPVWIGIILGSILMTLTSIYGFRIIERFSSIAVPLMLLFVVYVLYITTSQNSIPTLLQIPGNASMTTTQAISAVVGMVILTPVLMPDYSRFAKTDKDSLISILGLTIGFPLVLLAGGIPSLITGEIDIMKIMIGLSLTIPALCILIFSTWTTNTANLYSTQLTLSTVFTKTKDAKLGIIASGIGTLLALFGVATHFIDFLNISSIFIPPVSAIFIADFFFVKKQQYELARFNELPQLDASALVSWIIACIVAYLGAFDYITLTSISFFDSFIVAFTLYLILKKIRN
ncbi:cytosine permease [Cellulophaga sp. HaHa_2_95]|uniref:purine-cytosine permease family protein n=1 Tax=Cellulophaga TaxID=104264 RepID=UPI0015F43722|nr:MULTISPECIES: cytosine permease [Cellulophaga]MBA6315766.1 cytosine permease [Cellulophaga baltica]QXP53153.1 cytosine permease [Cellulophaga sp. HaHa_2_1]QXP54562.1 cytosine permease [Cellulophaga sp. HaHa_2_95]